MGWSAMIHHGRLEAILIEGVGFFFIFRWRALQILQPDALAAVKWQHFTGSGLLSPCQHLHLHPCDSGTCVPNIGQTWDRATHATSAAENVKALYAPLLHWGKVAVITKMLFTTHISWLWGAFLAEVGKHIILKHNNIKRQYQQVGFPLYFCSISVKYKFLHVIKASLT